MLAYHRTLVTDLSKYRKRNTPLDTCVVHRIGIGRQPRDVIAAFEGAIPDAAKATGYKMPYTYLVLPDGEVHQCLPLDYIGPHARAWSHNGIGVGCIGDFRRTAPQHQQWSAAVRLVALLSFAQSWRIAGHDELDGGSSDPNKQCPGDKWDMAAFRKAVGRSMITPWDVDSFWLKVTI